jgi:hypothetical protein
MYVFSVSITYRGEEGFNGRPLAEVRAECTGGSLKKVSQRASKLCVSIATTERS